MSKTNPTKQEWLDKAKAYRQLKKELIRDRIENLRYLKNDISIWYNSVAAVCFAVGGVAISIGVNRQLTASPLSHPNYFWAGSLLMIVDGLIIFFVRKLEMELELSQNDTLLREREADLWAVSKMAMEFAQSNMRRKRAYDEITKRITDDYSARTSPFKSWQWVIKLMHSSLSDVAYGLLLFPMLLIASQIVPIIHWTWSEYLWLLWVLIVAYVLYMVEEVFRGVKVFRKAKESERRIKDETLES